MSRKILLCLLLIVATAGVYWQVADHEFVNYDDPEYVVDNPHVNAGVSVDNVWWAFTSVGYAANWHPLTWLSHMLDVQLFGLDAGRHHLTNLLLHLANTALLVLLLYRMTGAYWQSLFVAALFALHPLHVESVAWIAERKDVLSTLFWLLTMVFYVGYVTRPGGLRYLAALCAFALGLLAKPMLVTLPVVFLLLDYWPLGRVALGGSGARGEHGVVSHTQRPPVARLLVEKIPFFALAIVSAGITLRAQWEGGSVAYLKEVPISFRFGNALVAYVAYLGKLFWPVDLAVIYPLPSTLTVVQIAVAGVVLAAITALCVWLARQRPYLIVGWLWFLVTLVPVIGLVQVGEQFIADRYTYVPVIGLFMMVAWGIPRLLTGRRYGPAILAATACVVLSFCTVLTWRQSGYWKNTFSLLGHAAAVVPNNYVAHNILGHTLVKMGRIEEAIGHYTETLRVLPDDSAALVGMGVAYTEAGQVDQASQYLDHELRIHPDSAYGHYHKGLLLMNLGELDSAIWHYREALRNEPDLVGAEINLGTALIRQGRSEEGSRYHDAVLRNNPRNAEARVTIGLALAMNGQLDDGAKLFQEAIRIKPEFADAYYNLGVALARQGRFDEAITNFRATLRLEPGSRAAEQGLAAALRRQEAARATTQP